MFFGFTFEFHELGLWRLLGFDRKIVYICYKLCTGSFCNGLKRVLYTNDSWVEICYRIFWNGIDRSKKLRFLGYVEVLK